MTARQHARKRILNGIALLNKHFQGNDWANRIHLPALQMGAAQSCILGQLFPQRQLFPQGFMYGLSVLGLFLEEADTYGFWLAIEESGDQDEAGVTYDLLTEIWREYLDGDQDHRDHFVAQE